jgi:hypothetical protein
MFFCAILPGKLVCTKQIFPVKIFMVLEFILFLERPPYISWTTHTAFPCKKNIQESLKSYLYMDITSMYLGMDINFILKW